MIHYCIKQLSCMSIYGHFKLLKLEKVLFLLLSKFSVQQQSFIFHEKMEFYWNFIKELIKWPCQNSFWELSLLSRPVRKTLCRNSMQNRRQTKAILIKNHEQCQHWFLMSLKTVATHTLNHWPGILINQIWIGARDKQVAGNDLAFIIVG